MPHTDQSAPARARKAFGPRLASALLAAGIAVPGAAARAAPAPAPDLGWDDRACGALTVSEGSRTGAPGTLHIGRFEATLAPPAGSPATTPDHLRAASLRTDGPASLDTLPPLFAGGLMIGLQRNKPAACDLTHGFERAAVRVSGLPQGRTADQRWSSVAIDAGDNRLVANTLHLHVESLPDDLMRVTEEITGFSDAGAGADQTPIAEVLVRVSARRSRLQALAAGGGLSPDDTVTIERMLVVSGTARVEAHGTYHPGTRAGHLEVHAHDMEAIRASIPPTQRDRVGAALLILRLAATHDPDGSLSWMVDWEGRSITVNGVTLPTSL